MKNLTHQTAQAFYFSLVFYVASSILFLLKVSFAPMLVSISLLVSLIWVVLALREIILSPYISNTERVFLQLFIIFFNILAGLIYFFMIRDRVIGNQPHQRKK